MILRSLDGEDRNDERERERDIGTSEKAGERERGVVIKRREDRGYLEREGKKKVNYCFLSPKPFFFILLRLLERDNFRGKTRREG